MLLRPPAGAVRVATPEIAKQETAGRTVPAYAAKARAGLSCLAILAALLAAAPVAASDNNPLTQSPGGASQEAPSPAPTAVDPSAPAVPPVADAIDKPAVQAPRHVETIGETVVPARAAGERRASGAAAAAETVDAQARSPSATEIIRSLAPMAGGNPNAPRMQHDVDAGGKRKVRVDYGRAINLTVFFRYDSAELTPEAMIQLEPLGEALRSDRLLRHSFLIAGHTDAAGDPMYNLDLSKRRAAAVRAWLVSRYGIAPSRLLTHGWGAGRLRNASQPLSGVNRRVEVALIIPARRSFAPRFDRYAAYPYEHRVAPSAGGRWEVIGSTPCGVTGLVDPRHRLASDELDDFHAAPTTLCNQAIAPVRYPVRAPRLSPYNDWNDDAGLSGSPITY